MPREPKIIIKEYEVPDYEERMAEASQLIAQILYQRWVKDGKPVPKEKKYLTVDELADYLSVSKSTIYSWTHNKHIPYVKLGTQVRFNRDRIKTWIRRREVRERRISV